VSLNWKEINLILEELDLPGSQIQGTVQSTFDVIGLRLYRRRGVGNGGTVNLLIALTPGACRMHETFRPFPKTDKPLRFAQFLNSRIVNGWIEEAVQLGENRIVRLTVRRGEIRFRLYIRLWSNAANFIVTDENGTVLDAMRRLPKKGEVTGGRYVPEENPDSGGRHEYAIRDLPGDNTFNKKIDDFYAESGGALSLEALREQAKRNCEGSIDRLTAALEKLRAKADDFASADRLREYGDIILANAAAVKPGDEWLEAKNFFATDTGETIRIKLDSRKAPAAQAEHYYEQ
jgi:predicted ribosome quality control (RQC) complex YloA/Tae2 family protein